MSSARALRFIVDASRRHAWSVALAALALTACGLLYASSHLGIDTDTDNLFSPSLQWRRNEIAFDKDFPQFNDVTVAVVRADTPEEAEETAARLAEVLSNDRAHFIDATAPALSPFFRRNGLLLMPVAELHRTLDSVYAEQPLIGPLAADPTARGLFGGIALMAEGVRVAHADLSAYASGLEAVRRSLDAAADGHPVPLSWQRLIGPDSSAQGDALQFLVMHPVLERDSLQPGLAATRALVAAAARLPDVAAGRARVDYTGTVPLNDAQFGSLTDGMLASTLACVALLAVWLFLALRSLRLIVPILITLLVGLGLTAAFAALAVGRLNLISVAFAMLFVGLAIDFAIQFAVRLRDVNRREPALADALSQTAVEAGGQIAVAAAAIACGFLAFAPTAFVGVAELGIIAGAGMAIAFVCTVTLLPALLWIANPGDLGVELALPGGSAADRVIARRRRPLLAISAVLAILGIAAAVTLPFDNNPLNTKDPDVEPMKVLRSLMDQPATNPFTIDIVAHDLAAARTLQARLDALPEVASTLSGADFVPADQDEKLDDLAQSRDLLATSLAASSSNRPVTAADLRAALVAATQAIEAAAMPADAPLSGIGAALKRLASVPDPQLLATNAALVRFLPKALADLDDSLSAAQPIAAQDLPDDFRRDWFLPDGRVHIRVLPTAAAQSTAGLTQFVEAVQAVAPDAGGPAVTITAAAQTILQSFQQAAAFAIVAISAILLVVLRSLRDAALVMAALLLSALLTALFARAGGIALNYANIIALPLLLGVGVSFNVYFVMNWSGGMRRFLGSATARAILFSALTTGTAFGSLAASHDRGMSSMGMLLLLGLVGVLLSTFVFLPALLFTLTPPEKA